MLVIAVLTSKLSWNVFCEAVTPRPIEVSLLPAMQKLYQQRSDGKEKDPVARCLPTGVPRITAEPFKIMQTPDLIVMIFEGAYKAACGGSKS